MREAANASQLRRNFTDSKLLIVPEVHWDFCTSTVMVMERMKGVPISQIDRLRADGIDLKKLSAPASRSSSPRSSATVSSTPTCTRATSSLPPTAATSRSISASSAR
jgi:hypothetical protein